MKGAAGPFSESAPRPRRCPGSRSGLARLRPVRSAPAEMYRRPSYGRRSMRRPLRARGDAPFRCQSCVSPVRSAPHARGDVPPGISGETVRTLSAPRPRRCPGRDDGVDGPGVVRSAPAEMSRREGTSDRRRSGPLRARGDAPIRADTRAMYRSSAPRPRRCSVDPHAGPGDHRVGSAHAEMPPARTPAAGNWTGRLRARGDAPFIVDWWGPLN